ncbi:hypothetical protein HK104_005272 [Borealophlyctis nickersoniae]|nr:hypothetical protein HK104_005272 [Borealophlyctis nickersoniae]
MQKVLLELQRNPQARKVFEAIQTDPELLQKVQTLGLTLQRKGFIDPSKPVSQPSFTMMARMFADSEVRDLLMEMGEALKKAGIDPSKDGQALASVFGMVGSQSGQESSQVPKALGDQQGSQSGPAKEGVVNRIKKVFGK